MLPKRASRLLLRSAISVHSLFFLRAPRLAESLALFALDLLDAFHHRQFFGHRAAQFLDCLPHLRADFTMRPVGGVFALTFSRRSFSSAWVARNRFAASSVLPMWSRIFWLFFRPFRR